MEILGYFMALVVGLSLGLIGGGGSILAVPILAYLFGLDEKIATAYSLFVVGSAALVGAVRQYQIGNIDGRTAVVFGLPAVLGVWIVRHFLIPMLPEVLFAFSDFEFTPSYGNVRFVFIAHVLGGIFHALFQGTQKWNGHNHLQLSGYFLGRTRRGRIDGICRCRWWVSDHPSIGDVCQS